MKRSFWITFIACMLACIMLACSFAACDTPSTPPEEQTTDGATEGTTQGETEGTTEGETEGTTEGTTSTEEGTTEPPVPPEINSVIADFNAVDADELKSFLTGANQVNVSVETDEDGEQYAVLSTSVAGANDPCVNFNFKKFYKAAGMSAVKADDYKYVVLKVRNVNCSGGTFELFFYSGKATGATPGLMTTSSFDLSENGWQYVLFDLSDFEGWTGNVNGFRFDYMTSALAQGETLHIAEIQFLESDEAYYQLFDIDWTQIGVNANDQAKAEAEQLLGSVTMPSTKFDT